MFDPFSLPFCAKFTRNLKLYYHNDKYGGFFVKVCLNECAKREYNALKFAYDRTNNHVPEPLLLFNTNTLSAYISPLYHFLPLTYDMFFANSFSDQICEILCICLNDRIDYPLSDSEPIASEQLKSFAIKERIFDSEDHKIISYIDNSYTMLSSIVQIPQHCDLTPYNFSIENKKVFLCDWEDYGLICFPGFDLATLIMGLASKTGLQKKLTVYPDVLNMPTFKKITDTLRSCGELTLEQWCILFPFYILLFSYLKKQLGYSMEYFETLRKFLNIVFHADNWREVFKRL